MDLWRTLLLFGFLYLVWNLSIFRTQPVREFIKWGAGFPFLFVLILGLLLVALGIAGQQYGLPTLLFDDRPLIQFLDGLMVITFLLYATFCVILLNPDPHAWPLLVRFTTHVLGRMGGAGGAESCEQIDDRRPVGLPSNGFLESLTARDLCQIDRWAEAMENPNGAAPATTAAHGVDGARGRPSGGATRDRRGPGVVPAEPSGGAPSSEDWQVATEEVERPARPPAVVPLTRPEFQFLFAPAVLAVVGRIYLILFGVIPGLLLPLMNGEGLFSWTPMTPGRLPWLAGVWVGMRLGVHLAARTSRWLAEAAKAAGAEGWSPADVTASVLAHRETPVEAAAGPVNAPWPWWLRELLAIYLGVLLVRLWGGGAFSPALGELSRILIVDDPRMQALIGVSAFGVLAWHMVGGADGALKDRWLRGLLAFYVIVGLAGPPVVEALIPALPEADRDWLRLGMSGEMPWWVALQWFAFVTLLAWWHSARARWVFGLLVFGLVVYVRDYPGWYAQSETWARELGLLQIRSALIGYLIGALAWYAVIDVESDFWRPVRDWRVRWLRPVAEWVLSNQAAAAAWQALSNIAAAAWRTLLNPATAAAAAAWRTLLKPAAAALWRFLSNPAAVAMGLIALVIYFDLTSMPQKDIELQKKFEWKESGLLGALYVVVVGGCWLCCLGLGTSPRVSPRLRRWSATLALPVVGLLASLSVFDFDALRRWFGEAGYSPDRWTSTTVPTVLLATGLVLTGWRPPRSAVAAGWLRLLRERIEDARRGFKAHWRWFVEAAATMVVASVVLWVSWAPLVSNSMAAVLLAAVLLAAVLLVPTVIVSGAWAVSSLVKERPGMAYPLASVVAYSAFSLIYNGFRLLPDHKLVEVVRDVGPAALPATASAAAILWICTSLYLMVKAAWSRYGGPIFVVGLLALFAWNGNAWHLQDNRLKLGFPGLPGAEKPPVFVETRSYIRNTVPDVVKLRDEAKLERRNRQLNRPSLVLLGSALFMPGGDSGLKVSKLDGRCDFTLRIEDTLNRLRLAEGDRLRIPMPLKFAEYRLSRSPQATGGVGSPPRPVNRMVLQDLGEKLLFRMFGANGQVIVELDEPKAKPGPIARLDASLPRTATDENPARLERFDAEIREILRASRLGADVFTLEGEVTVLRLVEDRTVADVRFDRPARLTWYDVFQEKKPLPGADGGPTVGSLLDEKETVLLLPGVVFTPDELGLAAVVDDLRMWVSECRLKVGDDIEVIDESPGPPVVVVTLGYRTPEQFAAELPGRISQAGRGSGGPPSLRLKLATDRGTFAAGRVSRIKREAGLDTETVASVELGNARRLRDGDVLILTWTDETTRPPVPRSGVFVFSRWMRAGNAHVLRPVGGDEPADLHGLNRGEWRLARPLNNLEALRAWKRNVGRGAADRPPLVIVTVSGGGIRSSVWVSRVLTGLEALMGRRFPYHIRMVTGASGGMVGGSYYVTGLPGTSPSAEPSGAVAGWLSGLEQQVELMGKDQLNEPAGQLAFHDLPGLLSPFHRHYDRGQALEHSWSRLTKEGERGSPFDRPLRGLAGDEAQGLRPSLVYTPMLVEDGRRLLISNLDLNFATRSRGGMLLESDSSFSGAERTASSLARPETPTAPPAGKRRPPTEVYSLSAVELSRLFPASHGFTVGTATRMSASFPWISPAVSLPTLPSRRVVDAGYYDNYGVNLAAMWLEEYRDWLLENTSGVLVVQIRDGVSQDARTQVARAAEFEPPRSGFAHLFSRLTWDALSRVVAPGFQPLDTPMHGVSNARQWSMSFRNDEQIEVLSERFGDEAGEPDFFKTVVFECPVEASTSWKLNDRERQLLRVSFPHTEVKDTTDKLKEVDRQLKQNVDAIPDWLPDRTHWIRHRKAHEEALEALGIAVPDTLSPVETEKLYLNYKNNLERVNLVKQWWDKRARFPNPPEAAH